MLKRALAKAADQGFTFYTHPEIEFFLLEAGLRAGRAADAGRPGRLLRPRAARHRRTTSAAPRSRCSSRWASRSSSATTRARPGQNEIDLRYADALTTADNIMTFRTVIKEVALEQGVYATFMPKPFAEHPGSGMHTHLSLFEGDRNAFHEAGAPYQLSQDRPAVHRRPAAGTRAEITAVTNQWVNSYKRLWGGGEAPAYVCWGHNNRSALVRVPMYKPGKGQSTRVEVRSVDSACNPYLAFACMLAAGLKGIEEGYELPDEAEDDVWELTDAERRAMGIEPLPTSLDEAIAVDGGERAGRRDPGRARLRLLPAQQAGRVGRVPLAGDAVRAGALPPACCERRAAEPVP